MTHLYVHIYIPSLNSDQHQNERSKYRSIIEIISRLNPTTFLPVFSVRCEISDRLIVPGHSIKPARNECGNKALFHSFLSANLIMAVELYRFPISTTRRAIPLSLPLLFRSDGRAEENCHGKSWRKNTWPIRKVFIRTRDDGNR